MSAFHRILPKRAWFRGSGVSILFWSFVAAICEALLLVTLVLLIDLLVGHGRATIRGEDLQRTSPVVLAVLPAAPQDVIDEKLYPVENAGVAATAVRYHDHWFGYTVAGLCRAFPLLKDNAAALYWLILTLAVLALLRTIAQARVRVRAVRMAIGRSIHLRQSIHRQALRLVPSDLDGREERETLRLFTDDVRRIEDAVRTWATRLPVELAVACVLLAFAVAFDWRLTLQCLVPVAMMLWVFSYGRERSRQARTLAESRAETELRILAEGVQQSRLIRGYAMEDFEREQFEKHLQRYEAGIAAGRLGDNWAIWTARTCAILCLALVTYLVSARVFSPVNPLPFSGVALLLLVLARASLAAQSLPRLAAAYGVINIHGDRVQRFLNQIPEVGQAVGAKFLEPVSRSIIYESVTYRDNGQELLSRFDLRIPAGASTALVSTDRKACRAAAYLLPRFIEPQAGRVLFDSEDTAWVTLESLRAETLYVSSESVFTGSVLENLICGDSRFNAQDATEAAKTAHAHQFIVKLPQGYETMLGEHGEQLAPGEAFRLALARAVLRNPAVMIIEEPDAPLDQDAKSLIDDAYVRILSDRTVIFLPARLSTVRRCDQVVLIENGRVAASGAHSRLVADIDSYRHWEYLTFGGRRRQEPVAAG